MSLESGKVLHQDSIVEDLPETKGFLDALTSKLQVAHKHKLVTSSSAISQVIHSFNKDLIYRAERANFDENGFFKHFSSTAMFNYRHEKTTIS